MARPRRPSSCGTRALSVVLITTAVNPRYHSRREPKRRPVTLLRYSEVKGGHWRIYFTKSTPVSAARQSHLQGGGRQSVPDHGKAGCYHDKQCPDEHGDAAQAKIVEHGSPHSLTMAKDTRILGPLNTRRGEGRSANPSKYLFEFLL